MSNYELRLFNRNGGVVLSYLTRCANDAQAWQKALDVKDIAYATFEIWCESELIGTGSRLTHANAN